MSEHNEKEMNPPGAQDSPDEKIDSSKRASENGAAARRASGTDALANDSEEAIRREAKRRSRRSFLVGGASAVAGIAGWRWLKSRPVADGIPYPLRRAHEFNESLARRYFNSSRLVQTFPPDTNRLPRVNGAEGLSNDFDPATWRLEVFGLKNAAAEPGLTLTLDDLKRLPRVEMMTQLKCIEGWSDLGYWAGARFRDFAARHGLATRNGAPPDVERQPENLARYVRLETPGGGYYVGLDIESALHPQTLLCYEMGGRPLTLEHGAPLRLYVPVKYGIKSLKRIGAIRFTDERPADYWAERGYDWYAGH